jgi:hypothetical protein
MAFIKFRGKTKTIFEDVTPSTALAAGTLVEFTSGLIAGADADEAATAIFGVLGKTTAATDSDYASTRKVPVIVPVERHVEWVADATGTFAATDIGGVFGISDSGTVDKAETTTTCFKMTGFISPSKIIGFIQFNGAY